MADWLTHLYCANKANETLQFNGEELDEFLYGNLLADVNSGWLVKPEVSIDDNVTHFAAMGPRYYWSPRRFYEKYEKEIKALKPLYVGYLFHLWLDVAIMVDFVSRTKMSNIVLRDYEVRDWKWNDMNVFIKPYTYDLSEEHIPAIVEAAKGIEEICIKEGDLRQIPAYLRQMTEENNATKYKVFDERTIKEFYDKTVADFTDTILGFKK